MAEGHLCVKIGIKWDAEVAFGHDKNYKNGTLDFYRKALIGDKGGPAFCIA